MRQAIIVLALLGAVRCGGSPAPPSIPTPLPPLIVPPPSGPVGTFTISGLVIDGWTSLPFGGVTVDVAGSSRGSTTTDANGRYRVANLLPGVYTVTLSKPLFRTRAYQSINVFSDVTHDGRIGLDIQGFPLADLTGDWVGHGPYRDEPLWLTLIQTGAGFEGLYQDRSSSSYRVSGRRDGNAVTLRIDVGGSVLTVEGSLLNDRCLRGVIKNEALGGNFPITFARGAPEFCNR